MGRTRLAEYGGPATLTKGWARSLLKQMKFSHCMCTTQAQIPPERVEELRAEFLHEIIDIMEFEEIPPSLIFNWVKRVQTQFLVQTGQWSERGPSG